MTDAKYAHIKGVKLNFFPTQISAGVCVTELYTLEGDFNQVLYILPLGGVCVCVYQVSESSSWIVTGMQQVRDVCGS